MVRKNCWEVIQCGRQQNGEQANELGVCPAAATSTCDGVNEGIKGGRFCWTVSGTFCSGKEEDTFTKKFMNCLNCSFLKQVNEEEGNNFILSPNELTKSFSVKA